MRAALLALSLTAFAPACAGPAARTDQSPGVQFPTTLGQGTDQPGKEPRAPKPSAPGATPSASGDPATSSSSSGPHVAEPVPAAAAPPDPEPLKSAAQWEFEVATENGVASVVSVRAVDLPKPVATPRRFGRYAIELWIGQELVERVRFDLPLYEAGDPRATPKPRFPAPQFEKGANVRLRVQIPRAERARRAVLVDRATSRIEELPWPPDRPPPTPVPNPKTP
jgi:hypothetical protein